MSLPVLQANVILISLISRLIVWPDQKLMYSQMFTWRLIIHSTWCSYTANQKQSFWPYILQSNIRKIIQPFTRITISKTNHQVAQDGLDFRVHVLHTWTTSFEEIGASQILSMGMRILNFPFPESCWQDLTVSLFILTTSVITLAILSCYCSCSIDPFSSIGHCEYLVLFYNFYMIFSKVVIRSGDRYL